MNIAEIKNLMLTWEDFYGGDLLDKEENRPDVLINLLDYG